MARFAVITHHSPNSAPQADSADPSIIKNVCIPFIPSVIKFPFCDQSFTASGWLCRPWPSSLGPRTSPRVLDWPWPFPLAIGDDLIHRGFNRAGVCHLFHAARLNDLGWMPPRYRQSQRGLWVLPLISPLVIRSITPPSWSGVTLSDVLSSFFNRPKSSLITQFAASFPS